MPTLFARPLPVCIVALALLPAAPVSAAEIEPDPGLAARFLALLHRGQPTGIPRSPVPTVGCPADGQQGPIAAPSLPPTIAAAITRAEARQLAYYKSGVGDGVLAPRGWKCFARYGSNGDSMVVAPADAPANVFSLDAGKTDGPAVVLGYAEGSTSGRFEVARVAARIFPAARRFVKGVQAEEGSDPKDFVFTPWPADRLARLSDRAVAFEAPAGAEALGPSDNLAPGRSPIRGFAVLLGALDQPSLRTLRVRLGDADADLYPAIAVNALPSTASLEAR